MKELTEEQKKYNDELLNKLQKCCDELYPHFDSVIIFANKHENNEQGTSHFKYNVGNFFASYGQIKLWIEEQNLNGDADEN